MIDLDRLLDVASETIEADFSHYYPNERLADLSAAHWVPGMLTHRKARVLLDQLPLDSAYKTWVRGNIPVSRGSGGKTAPEDDTRRWGELHYLVSELITAVYASSGAEDIKPYPVPEQQRAVIPRSTVDFAVDESVADERLAMLERIRANGGVWG